ncbi:hypothetical protein [Methylorubrum extorquens]|jgi:hypothetical protein|nr:hypothetical protein [Methylorubrum extorquens]MCP1541297.1 hypothetical protein [Methylorubrum extorquens]MCP1586166.1 hypothetical protein [Methylorubrum extorquens]GEL44452.1 hypothetical protein MEX01_50430 [Methylorubrum extorquens]
MKIRQYINEKGEFCAEITSISPILVNYYQINAMAAARGFENGMDGFFYMDGCPTAINQDHGVKDKISNGVWFYDRLTNFIDWGQDDVDHDIMRKAIMTSDFEA